MTMTKEETKTDKPKKIEKSEMVLNKLWANLGKKPYYDKINAINVFDNCWRINIYKERENQYGYKMILSYFVRMSDPILIKDN